MTQQFVRFLITGGIAAGVNVVSRYFLSYIWPFGISVIIAYLFGMMTAYLLARRFVFPRSGRGVHSELFRFTVINMFSLVAVWGISVGLARVAFPAISFTWHAEDIAHLIGVAAPAATSYIGHRSYSFRTVAQP